MATLLLRLVCVLLVPRVLGVFELSITIDGQSRALRWAAGTGETAATAFAARHGLVDAAQVVMRAFPRLVLLVPLPRSGHVHANANPSKVLRTDGFIGSEEERTLGSARTHR